jgi:hypothetical protein
MGRKHQSKARRDIQRKLDYERDVKELGDIKSSSGFGGLKMAGLKPPVPNRFRRKGEPPKPNLSIRELADQLYKEQFGSG